MNDIILLDTGPLGLITHPLGSAESDACNQWMQYQITIGTHVLVAGIADYELRREMLLNRNTSGVLKLNNLNVAVGFDPNHNCCYESGGDFLVTGKKDG